MTRKDARISNTRKKFVIDIILVMHCADLLQKYLRRLNATRLQMPMGTLSQMSAGLTHHVTPERLQTISKSIPKVLILTGDEDHLVNPSNSKYLKEHMPEAEYVVFEKSGHAIHLQQPKRYCALLERHFKEGKERSKTFQA